MKSIHAIFCQHPQKSAFFADGLPISDTGGGKLLDRNFGCWSI
jgi:hypothetical protein